MKNITRIFIVIIVLVNSAFADGWNSEQTSQTTSVQYLAMDNVSNKEGIHVVRVEEGSPNTLKYQLLNSSGTLIRTTTIDNGISNTPVILSDQYNLLYVVYIKGSQVVIKLSSNVGQNWISPDENSIDFESGHTQGYGVDAVVDNNSKIHIVYSTKGMYTDYELFYRNYNPTTGTWANFKNVTDHNDFTTGKDPSIAISEERIHVGGTYVNQGYVKSRDRNNSSDTWNDPITINTQYMAAMHPSLFADEDNLYAVYIHSDISLNTRLHFTKKSISASSWDDPTILTPYELVSPYLSAQILKTIDNNLHVMYVGGYSYLRYLKYNGTSWESAVTLSSNSVYNNPCFSFVSDDLYVNWIQFSGSDSYLKYRQYDASPVVPSSMSIATQTYFTVSWAANPEPDIQYYEVWRKVGNGSYYNISTTTSTSFVDPDYAAGGSMTLSYKTRSKDIGNNLSDYSSVVSVNNAAPFGRTISVVQIPDKNRLEQNYPNPFNPTTLIRYHLKDESHISIKVFTILGAEVCTLVNEIKPAGYYNTEFDASQLPSGVYLYRISVGNYSDTRKMVLSK